LKNQLDGGEIKMNTLDKKVGNDFLQSIRSGGTHAARKRAAFRNNLGLKGMVSKFPYE
jgi:hypothetical protein